MKLAPLALLLMCAWTAVGQTKSGAGQTRSAADQIKTAPRPDLSGEYKIQTAGYPGSKNLPKPPRSGTPRERAYSVDGQPAPLLPWARKLYDERIEAAENGTTFRHTLTKCLPQGMPMGTLFAFYPIQILQTSEQVTMLFEEGNHFRISGGVSQELIPVVLPFLAVGVCWN